MWHRRASAQQAQACSWGSFIAGPLPAALAVQSIIARLHHRQALSRQKRPFNDARNRLYFAHRPPHLERRHKWMKHKPSSFCMVGLRYRRKFNLEVSDDGASRFTIRAVVGTGEPEPRTRDLDVRPIARPVFGEYDGQFATVLVTGLVE